MKTKPFIRKEQAAFEMIMKDIHAKALIAKVYVVMGVSGVGKTTVGSAISHKHGHIFIEGDDFHPNENIKVMSSGQPLSDESRLPWLQALASAAALNRKEGSVFITCSALKRSYRDEIRNYIPDAKFIHLYGRSDYITKQMASREGHFMPLSLLCSQFDTLEPLEVGEQGITICIENGVADVMAKVEAFVFSDAV